jgi:primosomal protein N' (replication factor Y)
MIIVRVALDVPLASLFDYTAAEPVAPGQRVLVPFGTRQQVGVVMEVVADSGVAPDKLKPLIRVLTDTPPLSPELLTLLRFCSDYYHHPIGQTMMTALPARLRSSEALPVAAVAAYRLAPGVTAARIEEIPKRKSVQHRLLAALAEGPRSLAELKQLSSSAPAQLKLLESAGLIEPCTHEVAEPRLVDAHALTAEQQQAVDAVAQCAGFGCFLLHGITGSGKTEVYVHLMQQVLQRGGQVLLLVPEINLTPQLEQYFRSRFPAARLVSLHSDLGEAERMRHWQQAQSGEAHIVLGTRLAVFAELPRLGLIVVDEEHDSSFKQQEGLRYSARDVAIFRARQRNIPILLGSATPSLESYHNALSGRYHLLHLSGRAQAGATLPQVCCLNINQTPMHGAISENLLRAIDERMTRGEQSLVFINRRGYAPVLMCSACGWLSSCRHCAGKLVLHLEEQRLRCHHCGYQIRVPRVCPDCGNADLHPVGSGTQRVESVLRERFPQARILRVDRDSTRSKRAWRQMREQIHANEVDILVGTQMLAKGHDFPALTLVGVLNPDSALYSSDFRAPERLFALLMQVAGRAGRADKPGEVLIHTEFPDHPLYRALRHHDFPGWANEQLAERQAAGFPPFLYQAILRAEDRDKDAVFKFLEQARSAGLAVKQPVEIYGVVPSALPRRANHFRAQILIQAQSRAALQQFLQHWAPGLAVLAGKKLRWSLDVDPIEF